LRSERPAKSPRRISLMMRETAHTDTISGPCERIGDVHPSKTARPRPRQRPHHRITGPRSCTMSGRPTASISSIGRAWEGPRSITST